MILYDFIAIYSDKAACLKTQLKNITKQEYEDDIFIQPINLKYSNASVQVF